MLCVSPKLLELMLTVPSRPLPLTSIQPTVPARTTTPGKPTKSAVLLPRVSFFCAGVQQHDDKDEQHHDGAGVDDDLRGGNELRAQQQVEHRQRSHHHHQRQRAVDGMALQQQVDCAAPRRSDQR